MKRTRKEFSSKDLAFIKEQVQKGASTQSIANALKRSYGSIYNRVVEINTGKSVTQQWADKNKNTQTIKAEAVTITIGNRTITVGKNKLVIQF